MGKFDWLPSLAIFGFIAVGGYYIFRKMEGVFSPLSAPISGITDIIHDVTQTLKPSQAVTPISQVVTDVGKISGDPISEFLSKVAGFNFQVLAGMTPLGAIVDPLLNILQPKPTPLLGTGYLKTYDIRELSVASMQISATAAKTQAQIELERFMQKMGLH